MATDQPVDVARELSGHATVFIQVVDCADVTPCFNDTVSATHPDSITRCSVDVVTGVEHGKLCDVESWCVCECWCGELVCVSVGVRELVCV